MKIIELGAHGGFGGGERIIFDIICELKFDFNFLVVAPDGVFLKKFTDCRIIRLNKIDIFNVVSNIRTIIKMERPDILHCHGTRAATWGRLAVIGLKNRPKLVYTVHGFHLAKRRGGRKFLLMMLEKFLNRWSDTIISVSEADKEVMMKVGVAESVQVINNGVDLSRFEINKNRIDEIGQELNLENKFIITSVARLHHQKDIGTLLRSVSLIEDKDRIKVLLVGDGDLKPELKQLAVDLGIVNYVQFLGSRADVPEIILCSDVVVLSTNWEGFPLVPLEAGAGHRPIIATDVPGVRETVIDGQTGFLVKHGSAEDFAEKLERLIASPEVANLLGQNGYNYVKESFSRKIMVDHYADLYRKLPEVGSLQIVKLYTPVIGGVEKIAQQNAEEAGSDVLCCQKKGKRSVDKVNGIKVIRAASFGRLFAMPVSFDFINQWRKRRGKYAVVDFHTPFPLGDLAMMIFRPKGKLIVHYHSDIVRQKILELILRPLLMSTLKRADKILVSSPNLKNTSPHLNKFQDKVGVVPFSLDIDKYQVRDEEHVRQLKNDHGKFALYVGRFGYYKGLTYLVEAMKNVDYKLIMIGDGPERFKIEKLIVVLNLQDRIILLPFQDENILKDYFHAASVFVLPSIFRSEAFGIVLMEALACGTPLISTELGTGTSWVNQHNETGLVIEPKNSSKLSEAINMILNNNSLQNQFSDNAESRAREVFDERRMFDKMREIYKL